MDTTTIEIDKETHTLIRQYCIMNNVKIKDLIRGWSDEKLEDYRKKLNELKKLNL
tara:strand:+ start:597 stop:761 length:165 start_codon:yes stop_codon:yes gene_type:complete